jgi:hypothetical protein
MRKSGASSTSFMSPRDEVEANAGSRRVAPTMLVAFLKVLIQKIVERAGIFAS